MLHGMLPEVLQRAAQSRLVLNAGRDGSDDAEDAPDFRPNLAVAHLGRWLCHSCLLFVRNFCG